MAVKAVFWDLDGTLLDSLYVWDRVDELFFARRGLPIPPGYTQTITPMGFRQAAEYTAALYDLPDSPEDMIAEWQRDAAEEYRLRVSLKPGARDCLRRLRDSGIRLAVCTSSMEELYRPTLIRCGIADWFDPYIASHDVPGGKENPALYTLAADRLQLSPADCAVIDDIPAALASAKQAGMTTLAIRDPAYPSDDPKRLTACADYILDTFADFPWQAILRS